MRPLGFSTGALGHADFLRALDVLRPFGLTCVELSALRRAELPVLMRCVGSLDLSRFQYISVHAPSQFAPAEEQEVIDELAAAASRRWPIVLHPDAIHDSRRWAPFGDLLLIENMDTRKATGRNVRELKAIFGDLPQAGFCFDIGHARQFDSTMTEAYLLLRAFRDRLRQVHLSEVSAANRHNPLSFGAIRAFREVSRLISEETPIILETPVEPGEIERELSRAVEALPLAELALTGS